LEYATVIVPVRNEAAYIRECLSSLLNQTYPRDTFEIIVVDGWSSDGTPEIVRDIASEMENVRLLTNAAGIVPAAMNLGIRHARGEIIIRADGHNVYPRDYVENCVKYLEETGADNVGGPWVIVPVDRTLSARLVAAVLSNPFGVGDSHYRTGDKEGFVDTVPFGAFRRELFDRIGMYDEKLVRNQDNELNARIRRAGGRIYLARALATRYHPAMGIWQLLAQTLKTSQWHIFSMRQNRRSMGARHMIPSLFVLLLMALLLGSFFSGFAQVSIIFLLSIYIVLGFYFATRRSSEHGFLVTLAMPFTCLCFHIAYGVGTLAGLRYLFKTPSSRPIRAGLPV
jgi:glycosyltransferase involved in cell wall biosynthesis